MGGWLSSWLLTRDVPLDRARKMALGLSAAVMPAVLFVPSAPVAWALAIFSLAYFGQQSWSTLVMILPADIFPRSAVGAVAGLVGFGGAMGGVVFGQVVGSLLDRGFGYGIVFTLAGSFHVLAFTILCLTIPTITPVSLALSSPLPSKGTRMKITEIRTRVVQWKGKTVPLPPHFCTNPMDLLVAAAGLDGRPSPFMAGSSSRCSPTRGTSASAMPRCRRT